MVSGTIKFGVCAWFGQIDFFFSHVSFSFFSITVRENNNALIIVTSIL